MSRESVLDRVKWSVNLARIKKEGNVFEVVIDPDLAIKYKSGQNVELSEVLKSHIIFTSIKKSAHATNDSLTKYFGTTDPLEVAKKIIQAGEIQVTSEFRDKQREEKHKRIINLIHMNGIDPRTSLPHPIQRIKNAFEEGKIKIDYQKSDDECLQIILKKLLPILPIRFEIREIEVTIGPQNAPKAISAVKNFGKIEHDEWMPDGSWRCRISIPAGLQDEFFDRLNHLTHGELELKIIKNK